MASTKNEKIALEILGGIGALIYVYLRLRRFVHPGPFTLNELVVLAVVMIGVGLAISRLRVAAIVPENYAYPDATPEQYPQLDRETFDRYARELESIGFERAQDFSLVGQGGVTIPSFCRIYLHPREQMYAELGQLFPAAGRMPVMISIQTHFSDDWSVSAANNKPQPAAIFLRNPRALYRLMPGKTPFELLQAQREWRYQMIQELGIHPLEPISLEAYRSHHRHRTLQRTQLVRKGTFLARLGVYYKRKIAPVYEWRGDWPREAAKRSQLH
jgi:hypothetical protein